MKVCLNSWCSSKYLEKADEIKFKYKDRNAVIDYLDKYSATIILDMRAAPEEIDWDGISHLNVICRENFIVGAIDAKQIRKCLDLNIKFYFDRPVSRFEDVRELKRLHSQYVLIEAPLFFEMDKVSNIGVPMRLVPNVAYYDNWIPKENGLYGSWVRPEDIDLYNSYIDTIEFAASSVTQEEGYYRVYCEDKKWGLDLCNFIKNYGQFTGHNAFIPSSFTKARLNCGQRCQSDGSCHICQRTIQLSANKYFQDRLKELSQDSTLKEYEEKAKELKDEV